MTRPRKATARNVTTHKAPARKATAKKKAPARKRAPARKAVAPVVPDEKQARTGRPPIEIDEKVLEKLAGIHCTHAEMAAVLGCSTDTLVRRFADIIEKGREQGKASLRRKQFEKAMAGDRTLLIWLGKQYLGQADKQEHSGRDGKPIETEHTERRVYAWQIGGETIEFE